MRKLYVNGEQVTALGTTNYPAQNLDTAVNYTHAHYVGASGSASSNTFDGYLSEVNFIDGQQLDASKFVHNFGFISSRYSLLCYHLILLVIPRAVCHALTSTSKDSHCMRFSRICPSLRTGSLQSLLRSLTGYATRSPTMRRAISAPS